MSNTRVAPCRSAEDRAWDDLYRSVKDPTTATEVVELFDADLDVRKSHLALYLRCRQTVRAVELRRIRIERVAAFLHVVIKTPFVAMLRLFRGGTDVAIEMMPKVEGRAPGSARKSEPAARRVKKLSVKAAPAVQELSARTPAPAIASANSPGENGAQAFATVFKAKAD